MGQNLNNCTVSLTGEIVNKRRTRQNVESVYTGTGGRHFFMMLGTMNCRHTRIVGIPLEFEGRAGELLGKIIAWCFFSIITIGIYALVLLPVRYKQWVAKNTIFGAVSR